ncbi:hypothetical protein [Corynebacterium variabile]|uniref:hypothetical protein n=1 Tax=Corynebacterium variabile TaxID=1727 RepID=UPI003A935466
MDEAKRRFRASLKEFAAGGRRGGFLLGDPVAGASRVEDLRPGVLAQLADLFGVHGDMSGGELSPHMSMVRTVLQGNQSPPAPMALAVLNTLGVASGGDEAFARQLRDAVGNEKRNRVRSVAEQIRRDARGLAFFPMTEAKSLLAAARIGKQHGALRSELRASGILLGMPWTPPQGQLPSGFVALLNKAGAGTLVDLLAPDLRPQTDFPVIAQSPVTVEMLTASSNYYATLGGDSAMVQNALSKVRSAVGDSDAELLLLLQRQVFDLASRFAVSGTPARDIQQALVDRGIRTPDAARVAHAAIDHTKVEMTGEIEVALLIGTGQLTEARRRVDRLVSAVSGGISATSASRLADRVSQLEQEVRRHLAETGRLTGDSPRQVSEMSRHVAAADLLAEDDDSVKTAWRELPLEPPANLAVSFDSAGSGTRLTWDAGARVHDGAGFTVIRRLLRDGVTVAEDILAVKSPETTWTDSIPPVAHNVRYSVHAEVDGRISDRVSATVDCIPDIREVGVRVSRNSATVTWGQLPRGTRVEAQECAGARRTMTSSARGSIVFGDLPTGTVQELRVRAVFRDAATGDDRPSTWSLHRFTTTDLPSVRDADAEGDQSHSVAMYRYRIGAVARRKFERGRYSVDVVVDAPEPGVRALQFFPESIKVTFSLSAGTVQAVGGGTSRWKRLTFAHPGDSVTVRLDISTTAMNPVLRMATPTPGITVEAVGSTTLDL